MKSAGLLSAERFTPATGEQPPGLYVHIPFCTSKCAYCSFPSYPCNRRPPPEYLRALLVQAENMAGHPWVRKRRFQSCFIGGGTPTVYSGNDLSGMINRVLGLFPFVDRPEVTLEANPGSVDPEKLAALKQAGVNRLSIGVQSFADPVLKAVGRAHTGEEAWQAVETAREAGFDNVNLDLMYGLPGQTADDWHKSLETAVRLAPEHLALYGLMLEEDTPLARRVEQGELVLPAEEEILAMDEISRQVLATHGFGRYEISNYARPGRQCRHNINYWQNGVYLGLGAAAVSCFSGVRLKNVSRPDRYIRLVLEDKVPFAEAECLPLEARFRETVVMGLRLLRGVSVAGLRQRFGLTPGEYYGPMVETLLRHDLLAVEEGHLRLGEKGRPVANQVLARLV